MRVLLSTIGSRGDVQPLVALAIRLRALGHDARLCVPPDFQEWISGLGFHVTPIGPELRKMTAASPAAAAAVMTPERRRQLAEASVAAQFETVAAAAEGCETMVAATALQIAARSVAEKQGIPYVFAAYCANVLPSPHHPPPPLPPLPGETPLPAAASNEERWARDTGRFNALFGPALNSHRASIGLPPVEDVRGHILGERPWLAADPILGPWPDPADPDVFQPGAWLLEDDGPLSPEIDAFLDAGDPPVYFGFGSIRATVDLSKVMIETARALGRRAIVLRGWADLSLLDDESDCLAIDETNLQALFRRVAAAVHHGGAGTTTTAALGGSPQVIIPQMYDQHYWAQQVERLGIGVAHAAGVPTTASLTSALERALRPEVAARARSVAGTIRRDGTEIAARRLTEVTEGTDLTNGETE
jgi:vancomycin aglycone glucosyltransferase